MTQCLLNDRKKGGCQSCATQCPHRIALEGLSGEGGRVAAAGLPKDYRHLTLASTPTKGARPEVDRMLSAYVATFDRQFTEGTTQAQRIKSLYLWSESPGTGKTTTACTLINEWIVANYLGSLKRGLSPKQAPAMFLDTNVWQTDYNLATMTNDTEGLAKVTATMKRAMVVDFLVCDDIGIRDSTQSFKSLVHAVINARTTNGLPTVYTSNLPPVDMAQVFDARLADRIRDMCAVIHFDGESRRGKR